jgi:energy-coupling factor transport system substrate-specific component
MKFIRKVLVSLIVTSVLTSGLTVTVNAAVGDGDNYAGRFLANYATKFYNMNYNNFPGDESNAVLQTKDGFIWFGGYNGLYRYDGTKFTVWDSVSPNGFGSSNIRALFEDSNGILWIGTNDRGIVSYKDGIFTAYNRSHGLPSNTIRSITEGADGLIYGGTTEGIFRLDGDGKITPINLDTTVRQVVVSLCADEDNNIYAVLNNGELFVYTNDGRTVRHPYEPPVMAVRRVSGGRIVAGTRNGEVLMMEFDGNGFTRSDIVETSLINITAVYQDFNGYIWLPAENGIGFIDDAEVYRHVGDPSGVGFYSGILQDYQNNYWITGTRGGITQLSVSALTNVNALLNIEAGTVNAVVLLNGDMYIGTNNGLLIIDESGSHVHADFTDTVNTRVRGIFSDSLDNIWVCTYSELGVMRYTPSTGEYKSWTPVNGLISERTRLIRELPNGVVVVGTASGLSFIRGDEVITVNEAFDTETDIELPDIMILSMVYLNGTLYIGTDGNGVYAVSAGGTKRYQESDGLTGGVVLRMLADPVNGGVWVAASPGLCYIDANGQVQVIDKVPPYTFLDIMQFEDYLILMTSGMIMRTNANELIQPERPFVYYAIDRSSGLTALINANAWNLITPDGDLYFCTDRGVSIYGIKQQIASIIPFAGVARIEVDGTEQTNFRNGITIPRDAYRLTIELSFLSFGLVGDAALYYKLAGQDKEPIRLNPSDNFDISYTNLKGGLYTLLVWTEDSAGNIGSKIEIQLQKELQLLEQLSVRIALAVLAAALVAFVIFAAVKYRTRMLLRKQQEYRTIISQALSAIANTIDAKDSYTSGHSVRVAAYSVDIAKAMGMDKDFIENLYYIGLLHDVGKIGIPNEIINKPAALTDEEFNIMKQHSNIGHEILKEITAIQNLTAGAAEHHERWDGKGYSNGIAGRKISLEARIIAAADTYDAMSSDRSYRKGLPKDIILQEFKKCKACQFDPEVADIVIGLIERNHFDSVDVEKIIGINRGASNKK